MYYRLLLLYFIQSVSCDETPKTSLTFVIDDTYSMHNDIDEVKSETNKIFDIHLHSGESNIENFIIVTFNDPDVSIRTVTKDRATFRRTLDEINVNGGDDCPEYSMSGIQEGIAASLPGSIIYVFTDASAKDYKKTEMVLRMAQDLQCQVVYILTDTCDGERDPMYLVYHTVANATNGQVFHMKKRDIHKILKYVEDNIKGNKDILAKKHFPAGEHAMPLTIDGRNKDLTVSASGRNPSIDVTDPKNEKAATETLVHLPDAEIKKIVDPIPGEYVVKVKADGPVSVLASARTDFHFVHGFSMDPTTLAGSVIRPVAGEHSHLMIQLNGKFKDIEVKRIDILNPSGNVISSIETYAMVEPGLFVAKETFEAPDSAFNIAIIAVDKVTNETLSRRSKAPITPLNPTVEPVKTLKPIIHIEGGPELQVADGTTIKCEVKAYPAPSIVWKNSETDEILPSYTTSNSIYVHSSTLKIEKLKDKVKYRCVATNVLGEGIDDILVEPKPYFFIIERPKDTTIQYRGQGKLTCRADAYPPARVVWLNSQSVLLNDSNHELSNDGTELTIKNMDMASVGYWICEVRNDFNRKVFRINVDIAGAAVPKIKKAKVSRRALQRTTVILPCKIVSGEPAPTVTWTYGRSYESIFTPIPGGENLVINDISDNDAGIYRCKARNEVGEDARMYHLVVESPPEIAEPDEEKLAKYGERVRLACTASGEPRPSVIWKRNGASLSKDSIYNILRDNTLLFEATISDAGDYFCEAANKWKMVKRKVSLKVHAPIQIVPPEDSSRNVLVGSRVVLPCVAEGYPVPKIVWLRWQGDPAVRPTEVGVPVPDDLGTLVLERVQLREQGYYICKAFNSMSSSNITYHVSVSAPPEIQNKSPRRVLTGVVGDLLLRIPCQAAGSPKPAITWKLGDDLLPSDSEWYDISDTGTLTIKKIGKDSAGDYTCFATNSIGADSALFQVVVLSYPEKAAVIENVTLTIGESSIVPCPIPHWLTDVLIWFKDGLVIKKGELELKDVSRSNSGRYICRVSSLHGARSAEVRVIVGSPPVFDTKAGEENSEIERSIHVIEGEYTTLDCTASGDPEPKVTWWHNGSEIDPAAGWDQVYKILALPADSGVYNCVAKNNFGERFKKFLVYVEPYDSNEDDSFDDKLFYKTS